MARDRLIPLKPDFEDPARPGQRFVCPYSNQVEGLLASFPDRASGIEVDRVGFVKPRDAVVPLLGEANQSLPVLIFGDDPPADAQRHAGVAFLNDTQRILALLAERHGFPALHSSRA